MTEVPLNNVGTRSLNDVCGASGFTSTTAFGGAGSNVACQVAEVQMPSAVSATCL